MSRFFWNGLSSSALLQQESVKIPERVHHGLMHVMRIVAQFRAPLGGQIRVLRQNVFDREISAE